MDAASLRAGTGRTHRLDWEVSVVTKTLVTGGRADDARVTARSSRASACRCGQQLDCCSRSHCPRCGRSIHAP